MSDPEYPLLTVPGYELYQLAHLTTFVVDAIARHRRASQSDHLCRRRAPVAEICNGASAQVPASPGGFRAAASALPRSGATASNSVTARTPRTTTEVRAATPAAARPVPARRLIPDP
jgi:hypothetical protein